MNTEKSDCGYNKKEGIIGSIQNNLEAGCKGTELSSVSVISAAIISYLPLIPSTFKKVYIASKFLMPTLVSMEEWLSGEGPVKVASLTKSKAFENIVASEAPKISKFIQDKVVPISVGTNVMEEYIAEEIFPTIKNATNTTYNFYNNFTDCVGNHSIIECSGNIVNPMIERVVNASAELIGKIGNILYPLADQDNAEL